MKKKHHLKNKKRFFTVTICLLLINIVLTSFVVASAGNHLKKEFKSVTILPGDTLWAIAQKHSGNTDIRKYIYEIKHLNNLNGATIYAGQRLILPLE